MKKNNLICFALAALLLVGCSNKSDAVPSDNNNTNIDNTETNNTENNTNEQNEIPKYTDRGSVSLDGECEFNKGLPNAILTTTDTYFPNEVYFYYVQREFRDTSFDFVNAGKWVVYESGKSCHIAPGDYTLICYYLTTDRHYCYTSKFDFTVKKGLIPNSDFRISNLNHEHVINIAGGEKTLADVEYVLDDYCVFYNEDDDPTVISPACFEYEGKVTFKDNTIPLEGGEHTYKVVFKAKNGCFFDFEDEVTFVVKPLIINPYEVTLVVTQGEWSKNVTYDQRKLELSANENHYVVSLAETTNSQYYEINLSKTTNGSVNIGGIGEYTFVVSLKDKSLYCWGNTPSYTYTFDLEFKITINKNTQGIPLSAYFSVYPNAVTANDRILSGKECVLYVGQTGNFALYKRTDTEDELSQNSRLCRVVIVSNPDECIKKSEDSANPNRIVALKPGKATVNIIYPENMIYTEQSFGNVEVTVLPDKETYTFKNAYYYSDNDLRTQQWVAGGGFDEQLGVVTYVDFQSAFYFKPMGAIKVGITYSCDNVSRKNSQNCAYYSLSRKENERRIGLFKIDGNNVTVTNQEHVFDIPSDNRNEELIISACHGGSSDSGALYIKAVTFYYV